MQKTRLFEGNYSSLHEINETDSYFDVMTIIQRGLTFELGEKYEFDIDFMTNARSRVLVVIIKGNKSVFIARMVKCEKISCETLFFDKEKALRDFNIDPDEWTAVLANDKKYQYYTKFHQFYRIKWMSTPIICI